MAKGTWVHFVVFAGGILLSYSTYAYLQEGLREAQEDGTKFTHTTLSLVMQCYVAALLAGILDLLVSATSPQDTGKAAEAEAAKESMLTYAGLSAVSEVSFSYLAAMFCSNEALAYVPYPMQVLAKSCKMIPVMIGERLVQNKHHPLYKWVCVAVMAAGVALFQMSRIRAGKGGKAPPHGDMDETTASVIGGLLLLGSLALDGYTGPRQKTIAVRFKSTTLGFMALQNAVAGTMALGALAVSGSLWSGIAYVVEHPALWDDLLIFALASAVGQTFIFGLLFYFDSLLLTTVTTTRKFLSILLSVALNGHPMSGLQWFSVVMVFGSIAYDKIIVPLTSKRGAPSSSNAHDHAAASAPATAQGVAPASASSSDTDDTDDADGDEQEDGDDIEVGKRSRTRTRSSSTTKPPPSQRPMRRSEDSQASLAGSEAEAQPRHRFTHTE
jgi:UDP-galactose transporter B1